MPNINKNNEFFLFNKESAKAILTNEEYAFLEKIAKKAATDFNPIDYYMVKRDDPEAKTFLKALNVAADKHDIKDKLGYDPEEMGEDTSKLKESFY